MLYYRDHSGLLCKVTCKGDNYRSQDACERLLQHYRHQWLDHGGEKWVDSGCVLVIDSSDEKKKGIKNDSGVFGLCYCVDAGAIC